MIVNFSHGDMYGLHRIAIALTAGEWPDHVDHIDGDRSNNRIGNLRPCSKGQNQCNRGRQRNNTSGFKGVHRHYDGRWRAMITINKITHRLGVFDTPELAHQAYREAAKRLHGDFANAG
ncbi:hypothetical protein HKW90_03165 [Pseudomonas aeruginosa]|nr:HNH endonuclease [Pseudomonas aeruginosa]MBF3053404.1 hypothetical protein [Pseudomonas aeruginosa]NPS37564.1 hypothetical protein [Pseudomonas aeruginosa]NPS87283.1 hypothetical protein [Pseudomonas aeruginosa]